MQDNITPIGRPPVANPSEKTLANQQSAQRAEMKQLASEMGLPLRLHFNHAEETDIARLLYYGKSELCKVRGEPQVFHNGFWYSPDVTRDGGRAFVGAVSHLVEQTRELALRELPRWFIEAFDDDNLRFKYITTFIDAMRNSASHRSELARHIIQVAIIRDDIQSVPSNSFNRFAEHRVIPTIEGFHMIGNGEIIQPSEAMRFKITDLGWEIPGIDFAVLQNPPTPQANFMKLTIDRRWGNDLMRRIAAALLTTSKDIPIIAAHPDAPNGGSDTGKSTLMDCLALAFPGMVGITADSGGLRPGASNFSQHTAPLTRELIHFYDEVDKVDVIRPGLINSLTADTLNIELKRENPVQKPRIGTPFFVIGGTPQIDSTAQGIANRLPTVFHFQMPDILTQTGRYALEHDTAIAYLRAWLIGEAANLMTEEEFAQEPLIEIVNTQEARAASRRLMSEMKPDVDAVFEQHFTAGEYADFTLTSTIRDVIKGAGVDRADDKKVKAMVKRISPQATPEQATVDGKRGRGYRYLRQYQ